MKFKNLFYSVYKVLLLAAKMLSMDNRTVILSIHGHEGKIQINMSNSFFNGRSRVHYKIEFIIHLGMTYFRVS